MAEMSFTLNTEPHVVTIGSTSIRFVPEADAGLLLTARSFLRAIDADAAAKLAAGELTEAEERELIESSGGALSEFCKTLMVDDSDRAAWDALAPLPDRVLVGTQRFLLEEYGQRPTTQPSDS